MKLAPVIQVIEERCVNCHACIAACPVKFCNIATKDILQVNHDACIGCGMCVAACTHGARVILDDLGAFLEAASGKERMVAIMAPSVASNFPEQYLRLNGWLRSIGVEGIFDVGFGAELTVQSYVDHIRSENPKLVIAQPCPAIVTYIELYKPELIPYLAPADSPMMHTIRMIRNFYPQFKESKVLAVSPCIAKRREFDATGEGDYVVTFSRLKEYLEQQEIDLDDFPELDYETPPAERAVLFPIPGGLLSATMREFPEIADSARKIEGTRSVFPYLDQLPEMLRKRMNPLLIDCLSCEFGCNAGPGSTSAEMPLDELEWHVRKRSRDLCLKHRMASGPSCGQTPENGTPDTLFRSISEFWKPGLYARKYHDLSGNAHLKIPSEDEIQTIYREQLAKTEDIDELNCGCCGYSSCRQMAIAIHNGLSNTEHCFIRQHKRIKDREKMLAERESLLNGILDVSTEAYAAISYDGTITHVNDRYLELWGFKREEVLNHEAIEVRLSLYERMTDPETFRDTYYKFVEHQQPIKGIAVLKDGRIVSWHARMARTEGIEAFYVWSYRDITQQENAVETIRQNELMLRDIFSSIHDGLFIIDREMSIVRCNAAMEKLYFSDYPVIGKKCYSAASMETVCPNCPALKAFEEGIIVEDVHTIEATPNAAKMVMERTTYPLRDAKSGKIEHVLCVLHDVTFRMEQEAKLLEYKDHLEELIEQRTEALRDSEAELRALLDSSTAGIGFADGDGLITYANSSLRKMLGYNDDEAIIGLPFVNLSDVPENAVSEGVERVRLEKRKRFFAGTLRNFRSTLALRKKDGGVLWGDISASILNSSDSSKRKLVGVVIDVTERFDMIRELSKAKEEAEAASIAKSQFLAHMSHEIRTPLNGVVGLTELLLGTDLTPKQFEYGRLVRTSGQSLLFLINDILDFSKIEAGKLETQSAPFELDPTVESAVGVLASRAHSKGLDLCVFMGREIPRLLMGDEDRLRQVLINLIGNAIKFTDHGGVSVRTTLVDQATNLVKFEIIDTGIGIPQDRADRLFQSFSQVDTSYARRHGGTGLGLVISKRLIELMGGEIHVESEDGKGSNFHFSIPFGTIGEPKSPGNAPSKFSRKRSITPGDHSLNGLGVLVASGGEIQRTSLCEQFSAWGMNPVPTVSNWETFELLLAKSKQPINGGPGKQAFSFAVLDCNLPDGDTVELFKRIRSADSLKELPVIMLIPLAEDANRHTLVEESERMIYVTKPVFTSSLFDAVSTLLFGTEPVKYISNDNTRGEQTSNAPGGKTVHILVAEDNPVNQIVTRETLLKAGFTCDIASNGLLACEAMAKNRYDIVLMDCQMPEMDGLEATIEIRRMESQSSTTKKRVPIIALTANVTTEDMKRCLEIGMDAFCSKPIDPNRLIESIRSLIE